MLFNHSEKKTVSKIISKYMVRSSVGKQERQHKILSRELFTMHFAFRALNFTYFQWMEME